ncbi:MAG: DNA alkylation repair protein [Candidatus Heimdallarchaeota archaeon]|nr:DNA alkylation repair protein [Candidatus Heimdallarchaeota archaeon]MCK4877345.1 DNA alkylation repair protein [Candidatus Heimdallarchaeota archaeon]
MNEEIKMFTKRILHKLQELADEKYQHSDLDYSELKSKFKRIGVRTPDTRKLANEVFRELKAKGITKIDDIIEYCEYLQQQRISELRTIAVQWSFKAKDQFKAKHFATFENWLKTYVTGWGSTDNLCVQSLGFIVHKYPELIPKVKTWTNSSNQWVRRASAVTLIYGLRRGEFLKDAFEIADVLFNDQEMYVLKGYGWMLKEASNNYRDEVFKYVLQRKKTMPRISLRYAIEKMPENLRKEAMS